MLNASFSYLMVAICTLFISSSLSESWESPADCSDLVISLRVSSWNRQLEGSVLTDGASVIALLTELALTSNNSTWAEESTALNISARYCEPSWALPHRDAIELLVHGITYTKDYWSALGMLGDQSRLYSWVDFATRRGYATLSIDRAGDGASSHPNPFHTDQISLHAAVANRIAVELKRGKIIHGRSFEKVIYVGHSQGSVIGVELAATYPDAVDAMMLTGYAASSNSPLVMQTGLVPAKDALPARFGSLDDGYLVTSSFPAREKAFYGRNGTFDPQVSALDFDVQQTVSVGELATFSRIKVVSNYSGPVTVITGNQDAAFCYVDETSDGSGPGGECGQGKASRPANVSSLFPAASSFSATVLDNIEHCINLHYEAVTAYTVAHDWIDEQYVLLPLDPASDHWIFVSGFGYR
ncbi:Alpha/beta hydrolase family-domain-containing protein [Aspergillus welwitschiae]|uniref:Alpha/beta hydrolase family-domain-containing protein n=1 Tax=Aspergillus welwitschiae TaxID=1341132 RepID=A0A3F3PL00_9EURO|nr:Alpha/beta hydrolase family-domain-containing protein [Aspergillus welwitschiae]RDH27528.1 Alpha/beta hydrolase family-domain-containing protein [Aspergillus welwitschiae]